MAFELADGARGSKADKDAARDPKIYDAQQKVLLVLVLLLVLLVLLLRCIS